MANKETKELEKLEEEELEERKEEKKNNFFSLWHICDTYSFIIKEITEDIDYEI